MANEDVLTIENGVVTKCDENAVDVVIPEGVTEIGDWAFNGCKSLTSVVIPESVKKIGWNAFEDCESLSSVVIPASVTEIGGWAFSGCKSLTSVVIGEGVTEIGKWAFGGCESLSSVVIGEGVTKIGEYAFWSCKSLKSIVIPSTVTSIGEKAFDGCNDVENVVSASSSFPFNEKTRKLYDATKKTKKIILVLTAAKEEAKKEKIEQVQNASASAVLDSILSEHKAETEVVRNKTDAYLRVKASDSGIEILLPDSKVQKWMQTLPGLLDLAATGADAGALRKYAADSSLEDASRKYVTVSKDGIVKLKKDAKPVYLVIGEGVTEIGYYAFKGCESLSSVVIPASVTEIGAEAFRECRSLSSVVIPEGVKKIGDWTFRECWSLSSVEFGGTMAQWESVKDKELNLLRYIPAKTVKCSDGEWQKPVVFVKNGVAVECLDKSATSVTIPEGVTKIDDGAFYGCKSLTSVVIHAGVTKIGWGAFKGCESLSSVVIPAGVTEIGERAFLDCKSLSSVEFGGTLAQWEAIERGDDWNEDVPAKTVKCTDGEVSL